MKIIPCEEKVIVRHHSGGYREYRIPGILSVGDALLLAFEARNGEGEKNFGDWGDIDIIVLYLEEGKEPREVLRIGESALPADGTMCTYNNPVLIPDGNNTHLIYHKNYERVYIVTSRDGGKTWSDSREITDGYQEFPYEWNVSATGPGHGIQMGNGRLVVPVWLANGAVYEDGMRRKHAPSIAGSIYSDNHGISWHANALVPGVINANETSVAQLSDGRLLFNFRNMNEDKRRVLGLSSDGGKTFDAVWSSEDLRDPGCCSGLAACKGGVLFSNCDAEDKRINLSMKFSNNAGQSWMKVWDIDPSGGYSDIAVVDKRVYIFYERTDPDAGMISELVLKSGFLE